MNAPHEATLEKSKIIGALGEDRLLLPGRVNAALAANDRVKYLLTLLQTARQHAERPDQPAPDLRAERTASGVVDSALDTVVASSSRQSESEYRVPQCGRLCDAILGELATMLVPLVPTNGNEGDGDLQRRFGALREALGSPREDLISGAQLELLTSGNRERADSVHLVVMDAHKALNKLQQSISVETVNGARVYGIASGDRALVQAFMRGVNRTAPLKFDHPGLGTTATRVGERLVLQNDIGTTDAHVLVVHVTGRTVTTTYTDIHLQRLMFFQSLFEGHNVRWDDTLSKKDKSVEQGVYHLCLGTFEAADPAALEAFLAFLGSRLVFLIDWNRARKRLRNFLPKRQAVALLRWAAEHEYGHIAFLKAGGERIVYDALEFAVKGPFRFGEPLYEMLGVDAARQYLQFVLKAACEALRQGRPESLVRDEARAELFNYFRSAEQNLLDLAAQHAALITEIAGAVRDGLLSSGERDAQARVVLNARRAKQWEKQADELLNRARNAVRRDPEAAFFAALISAADDIADELEEAAFHLTLPTPGAGEEPLRAPLRELAGLLVQGAQEYLKAIETARLVRRGGAQEDMQDFLESIHRIVGIERQTDDGNRSVESALAASSGDFRQLYLFAQTAKNLEQAADALMHTGLVLRDHVLGKVMGA